MIPLLISMYHHFSHGRGEGNRHLVIVPVGGEEGRGVSLCLTGGVPSTGVGGIPSPSPSWMVCSTEPYPPV